ncbi:MAG: DUF2330 domain-containing protein [Polyangiaceae bacterium]|nr:DUF2330 domain-containing protein [Polyangiaceae bacterium]
MPRLLRPLGLLGFLCSALALCAPSEANACGGGTFYQETQVSSGEDIATTGHRVVISLSKTQTVLWDQIVFRGAPEDFAWVYPVKAGTVLEVASDSWAAAFDETTAKKVFSPTATCYEGGGYSDSGGSSCNMSCMGAGATNDGGGNDRSVGGDSEDPVQILNSTTAGPYDVKTITSDVPGAIGTWLKDNGYNVSADASPILDAYAADGFDFIALRLQPGQGVSAMKPVRVITPGPTTTFPMRMLAVGAAEKVAINLFVLTEGTVQVDGYANTQIAADDVVWDWESDSSNYVALREEALSENGGATFLTSYARGDSLFKAVSIETPDGSSGRNAIAAEYLLKAEKAGEASNCNLDAIFANVIPGSASEGYTVVDLCDADGNCAMPGPSELDSRVFTCGDADDLSVALIGMHPRDVWVTRLEAELPKSALDKDLILMPVPAKTIEAELFVQSSTGDPCDAAAATFQPAPPQRRSPLPPAALPLLAAAGLLASAVGRRLRTIRRRAVA